MQPTKPVNPADSGQPATSGVSGKSGDASRHTPGPWIAVPTGDVMRGYGQTLAIAEYGKPNLIAGVFGDVKGGSKVAAANGALLMSAPDLLAELKDVTERLWGALVCITNDEADADRKVARARALIAGVESHK